jgi:hypothetical protein
MELLLMLLVRISGGGWSPCGRFLAEAAALNNLYTTTWNASNDPKIYGLLVDVNKKQRTNFLSIMIICC